MFPLLHFFAFPRSLAARRTLMLFFLLNFDRKKLTQPGAFPITLQDDELCWKLSLDYNVQTDKFLLFINDEAFEEMPFQAEVAPSGPQNIKWGTIKINEVEVHEGFEQYTPFTVDGWRADYKLKPTVDIFIFYLMCTSSEVLNSLFDDLGLSIDKEQGLKKLTIERFGDKNILHEWPLGQLVLKSPHLEYLKISWLFETPSANISQLLEFVGLAATNSSCLHTLHI